MKENKFRLLKADILAELNKLSQIERELSEVLDKIVEEPSSIELRAIGSILHDFYCGVENVFRIIANGLDGEIPDSEDWHIQLLNRMSLEIEDVRPAIVSPELHRDL
ncbi:MAG: hypothetical protein ONB05_03755, partial [candidate division KSB1 bacterium]|nr:hypothetical protein [candidate division KSB1 bacterium]